MKCKSLLVAFLCLLCGAAHAQITVTTDPVYCGTTTTTLHAALSGNTPIDAGITVDDEYPPIPNPIGFTFNFYGISYTKCLIGPNGTICFDTLLAGGGDDWGITRVLLGNSTVKNSICGPWCDIDIVFGGTITYSTDGVAPNRRYVVNFCTTHMYSCTSQYTTTQIVLHETTNIVDIYIAHKTVCSSWNGGYAIVGVQNATGTASTAAPGRDFPSVWTAVDEAWEFSPNALGTAYTAASIPFSPVPYASSAIYWYDATTGTYLGTGTDMTVDATSGHTFTAAALGCGDTSFTETVIAPPVSSRITGFTNQIPTVCGLCDGKITVHGLLPGFSDTLNYDFDGIAQPTIVATVAADSTITINNLCAGTYTNFTAIQASCVTPPAGPDVLANPAAPNQRLLSFTNPTQCGICNGTITIHSFPPASIDTVYYSLNGTVQPPVITSTRADSSLIITGLCVGKYAGFSVKIGDCQANVPGSDSLFSPQISAGFTDIVRLGCTSDTVIFNNTSTYAGGPLSYLWRFGDAISDTESYPVHVYSAQGTYTVNLYASNHYCTDTFSLPITISHPLHDSFTIAPSTIICQGTPVTFINQSTGLSPAYTWYFGDGGSDTASASVTHSFARAQAYTVTLIAHDFIPCYDTFSMTVTADTLSGISISATDSVFCMGAVNTLFATFASEGNTALNWNFGDGVTIVGDNPAIHAYDAPGSYTITASALYRACPEATSTRSITVFPYPLISLGPDTSLCPGSGSITITDIINHYNQHAIWVWNTGDSTASINVSNKGSYIATVSINGCPATDTLNVLNDCYLDLPKAFTPDGDGQNDYFYPRQYLSKGLTAFKMDIYNRWGELLFESENIDGRGWDGKLNNVLQPQGVYIYIIEASFKDGKQEHQQGNLTLLR